MLQALLVTAPQPLKPIIVQYRHQVLAMGRGKLGAMNEQEATLYLKKKFGLSDATKMSVEVVFMDATINQGRFVALDMGSWDELIVQVATLRLA
ncbi:hypothetical protein P691DRAFT_807593 [Macrolepiota fuliginosa MF-IS2]|uniref:Uncharacterized protein n=1 Tax=Macrolepiota fuliginosa MF-IS2 TaxID=1400762 RepID=A0A9P5XHF7_9AGAR|nr:hypothetical protein P691DRAFT_807593 [Macrolepiota fuliginosa MF-IS2]